jgi:signal peptidase II
MTDLQPPGAGPDGSPPARRATNIRVVAAVLAACVGLDQATKRVAVALLPEGHRVTLAGGLVRLERVRNEGAFLGLGARLPEQVRTVVFTWGVGVLVLGALLLALHRASSRRTAVAAALVAGGGLGNLWDRLATGGSVIDFVNLGAGPLRTGIFNAADVAIVAGVALLALAPRRSAARGA